jgi:hypothetical protein
MIKMFTPEVKAHQFLVDVAKGKQDEAERLLNDTPAKTQTLLLTSDIFTDYSGRTFKCTAYEYAYWAKDTHMCRMLERHMDEETKAKMLARININDRKGLAYQQNGEKRCSTHFDFKPLIWAYREHLEADRCYEIFFPNALRSDREKRDAAWLYIGKLQRDLPAHVAQEYCRRDGVFWPLSSFEEPTLDRNLTYKDNCAEYTWFPCHDAGYGLGFTFAIAGARGSDRAKAVKSGFWSTLSRADMEAITELDVVRTADLKQLRKYLEPPVVLHSPSM